MYQVWLSKWQLDSTREPQLMENFCTDNKRRAEDGDENANSLQHTLPRVKRQFIAPKMVRKPAVGDDPRKTTAAAWQLYKPKAPMPLALLARSAAAKGPVAGAASSARKSSLPVASAPTEPAECQYYKVLYTKRSNKARPNPYLSTSISSCTLTRTVLASCCPCLYPHVVRAAREGIKVDD